LEVLEDQLPRYWEPDLIFMQDNASIHTSRAVRQWFRDMGIPLLDWPPYSPDLNLIEQVWFHLKKKVLELYPELEFATRKTEDDLLKLEQALIEAWDALPTSLFESLVKSMPRRVMACYKAKGWYTKY
jgi:transposase